MNKALIAITVWAMPLVALAQEAASVAEAPVGPVFPWADNAVVVLVITGVLGILSMVSRKIPGPVGKAVNWLVDLFSANIKH